MFKHLQKLLLIAALLCVPWVTQAQCNGTECTISISGTDQYGDGWNDASVSIYQGTTLRGTFTLTDGSSASATFTVCSDDSVRFVWDEGMYDDECGFTILNGDGSTILANAAGDDYVDGQTIITAEVVCPACVAPTNFAAFCSNGDVTFSWTDNNGSSWEIVYDTIGFNPDMADNSLTATTDSYLLSGLDDGIYEAYIRTDCGVDGFSIWVGPITFAVGGCIITVEGEDSFGDGWNGGSLAIVQGGNTVATVSMTSGYSVSVQAVVADSPVSFVWSSGSYDSEVSISIKDGGGATVYTVTQPNAGTIYTLADPCPSCLPPTNLVVDSIHADAIFLSWDAGNNTDWVVTINDSSFAVNTNEIAITDLTLNTVYNIGVSTVCDGDDTSSSASVVVRTLAGDPISAFPYMCGFEIDVDNDINEALNWVLENGTQTNYWMVGTATNNGGNRSLYITDNGTSNSYSNGSISYSYAYATFIMDSGAYAFSYDWKCQGESHYYDFTRVFLTPGATDFTAGSVLGGSTYSFSNYTVPADWFDLTVSGATPNTLAQSSGWQTAAGEFHVNTPGTYKLVFVWANDGSGGSNPPTAIDNVMISRNTCPRPTNLQVTNVTSDSISITWQPGGQEGTWIVRDGENEYVTNTNDYSLSNLNPNTVYHITVQAVCMGDDSSMYTSINVRTACGIVTELPIFEDFETTGTTSSSNNNFIPCWHKLNNATSYYYPYISNSTTYNHTPNGSYGIYWYNTTTTTTYGDYQVIVLPGIDTNALPVNTTQLSFWARSSSTSYYPVFYVGVMSDPDSINTFQYFDTINVGNSTQWQKYTTYFANFTGEGQYIAILANRPSSSWYAYVDDITLDSMYSCFEPVDVSVLTAVQPDSVVINWAPNALGTTVGYEIAVGPAGFNPDTATNVITLTDTIYTFTNLLGGVSYDFYVRADCSGDGYSHWTEPMSFSPGQYVIGTTGTASVSMCGGVIYDDGGPNGQYSNNVDYQLTVYPSSADSMLTFYGSAYTEGSIDYLRIYEGVGTNGNLLWQTSTSSAQDNIPLTTCMSGPITMHFHTDGSIVYSGFEVHVNCIAAPECAAVENLAVTAGPVSAIATWDEGFFGEYTGATVEYKEDTATDWTVLPMTTNTYIAITGLTPNTDYDLRVATDCNGFTGAYSTTTFSTRDFGCLVSDPTQSHSDTITGTSSTTSYNIPVNNFYNNTFSEQLYTNTDLGGAGTLVSFSLHYGYSSPSTVKNNCMVYMANTTVSSLNYSNYVDPATMTLVYSGSLNCSQGWNEFTLTTPFSYSGGNLVVAVIDNSGDYDGSSYVWNCHNISNMAFSWYSDSYTYPNSSMSKVNHAFRPNMIFNFLSCIQSNTCAEPPTAVVDVTTTTVDIAWAPGSTETSWNVYYRQAGAANFTQAAAGVTTTYYQFTNLNSGTNYEFKVESVCDTQLLASTVSASTLCATISSLPYTEDFNNWGTGHLPNCWYNTGAYSTTNYSIISGSQNMSGTTGGSIYMYSSSSASYISRIIMPALDTNLYQANQTQLVFYVKYTSTSYGAPRFNVGVMEDANDLSTWTTVATVQHPGTINEWMPFEVPLDSYTGQGSYIGIQTEYPGTYFYCYLDNVTLEQIPTCPRPDSLMAGNATTTSVTLSWHERGGATNWIIEYGPRGFQLGTGTTVATNSNPFTLMGVPAGYQGEYYVRSVCSSTDTGDYSRVPCIFGTLQIPATLPYNYDFEDATEWGNWQTCSNVATDWYRGTAIANNSSNAMYISADQGTTYIPYSFNSVVNAAAYRDVDFGSVQNSFTVSFDARVGGTISNSYDGLMVFLVDPNVAPVASQSGITSPWGNVNDLYRIATVRLDTNWTTYTASFDTISGIKRVAFFWFNQNTGASYANIAEPAAVDNIHIDVSACARPLATTINAVTASTASISWTGPAQATYEVIYRPYPNGTVNNYVQTSTNSITLTGLETLTQYAVWVRKICGNDTSLTSDGITFTTEYCDNVTVAENWDSTMSSTTSSYSPIGYATYNYSYVQTIIDSAYLATIGGDISAFSFSAANTTSSDYYTHMDVYMANVPESNLSSGFILPDSTTHVFVKVMNDATLNFTTTGEQMFGFDTTFTWDGHSNVLFAVNRGHGSWSSSTSFNAHTATSSKMRYVYTDSAPYDPSTVSGGTASTAVGDIRFYSCGLGCAKPVVIPATNVSYNGATVNWSGNAADYEVAYKAVSDATWPAETPVTGNSYDVTGLAPATQYQFRVRAICDATENLISDWTMGTFTTDSLPCFEPSNIHTENVGYTTATLAWTAAENQNQWSIHVWNSAIDTDYVANANPYTVTGLRDSTRYYATVKAICGDGTAESGYSDTVEFTTGTCAQVTGVQVTNLQAHSATISWTSLGVDTYEIEYGNQNFSQGDGTKIVVNGGATTYNLTGLTDDHTYSVFVRAKCEEGVYGKWSTKVDFTTPEETGINTADGTNLSIFPNPTSNVTTISVNGVNGEVSITIVDMNGRTVLRDSMECEGGCTKSIEVSGLAQGAYFVRVSGDSLNMVKKLIVK